MSAVRAPTRLTCPLRPAGAPGARCGVAPSRPQRACRRRLRTLTRHGRPPCDHYGAAAVAAERWATAQRPWTNHDPRLTRKAEPREAPAIARALVIHGTRRLDLALLGVGPRPAPATRCAAHLRCSFRSSLSVFLPVLRCGGFVAPQPGRRVLGAGRAGTSSAGLVQLCSCSADFPRLRLSSREPVARCLELSGANGG